jgi:hypothetical protein
MLFQNESLPIEYPTAWYHRWQAVFLTSIVAAALANMGTLGVIGLGLINTFALVRFVIHSSSPENYHDPRLWFDAYIAKRALAESIDGDWNPNALLKLKHRIESVKLKKERGGRYGPIEQVDIEHQYLTELLQNVEFKLAYKKA